MGKRCGKIESIGCCSRSFERGFGWLGAEKQGERINLFKRRGCVELFYMLFRNWCEKCISTCLEEQETYFEKYDRNNVVD